VKRTGIEAAETIERFVSGTDGNWDWDDFISFLTTILKLKVLEGNVAGRMKTSRPMGERNGVTRKALSAFLN
jgi:hypothetical protein